MIQLPRFIRKMKFKKAMFAMLERSAWELEANALFERSFLPDLETLVKQAQDQIKSDELVISAIGSSHTREDREKKKGLEEKVKNAEASIKSIVEHIASIKKNAQTSTQRAADIQSRRAFFIKNI